MSSETKDEDMMYVLSVDEHDALRERLHELPDTMPPRAVWTRIREQARGGRPDLFGGQQESQALVCGRRCCGCRAAGGAGHSRNC